MARPRGTAESRRQDLRIKTVIRRQEPDAWLLSRPNLLRELRFAMTRGAEPHQIIRQDLGIRFCELDDRKSPAGHHRMGWDKIVLLLRRLGYELHFTIRRKDDGRSDRADRDDQAVGPGVPNLP